MHELRTVTVQRHFTEQTAGSVLYRCGNTVVLCTASLENKVPDWMVGKGKGWITAEYNMLPGSTSPRKARERAGKVDGRTTEIQRLIGRSFRAVADLKKLGERSPAGGAGGGAGGPGHYGWRRGNGLPRASGDRAAET